MNTLLVLPEVLNRTGIRSKPGLYAMIAKGQFPKPVKIGLRSVAWPSLEVQAWIDARIAERDQGSAK